MHTRFSHGLSRFFGVASLCLLMPLASRANISEVNSTLGVPALTAVPGSTGTFEIDLAIPAPVIPETITAFSLTLTATSTGGSGLLFTAVSMATTPDAYVFQGVSADTNNGTPFSSDTFSNVTFTVADADTNTAGVSVTAATTFGLVEVSYSVAANATLGTYLLTPTLTLTQTGSPGTTTTPAVFTIVPEPSTWAMLSGGGSLLALVAARRRARQA